MRSSTLLALCLALLFSIGRTQAQSSFTDSDLASDAVRLEDRLVREAGGAA